MSKQRRAGDRLWFLQAPGTLLHAQRCSSSIAQALRSQIRATFSSIPRPLVSFVVSVVALWFFQQGIFSAPSVCFCSKLLVFTTDCSTARGLAENAFIMGRRSDGAAHSGRRLALLRKESTRESEAPALMIAYRPACCLASNHSHQKFLPI